MKIPFITGEAPEGNFPINWYFLPEKINGRNACEKLLANLAQ